jgi:hypothetical protein
MWPAVRVVAVSAACLLVLLVVLLCMRPPADIHFAIAGLCLLGLACGAGVPIEEVKQVSWQHRCVKLIPCIAASSLGAMAACSLSLPTGSSSITITCGLTVVGELLQPHMLRLLGCRLLLLVLPRH